MDIATLERHLAKAEANVREGAQHVRHQREIVAKLEADRLDVSMARHLLSTFERLHHTHVADRDRIAHEIADLTDGQSFPGQMIQGS